jgi:hypothetical protein
MTDRTALSVHGSRVQIFLLLCLIMPFFLFISGCDKETPLFPGFSVNPVLVYDTFSLNRSLRVDFYGNNNVSGFIGYRIYVNSSSNATLVWPAGPQVSLSVSSVNQSIPFSVLLNSDSAGFPVTNGKKYYISITAVNQRSGGLLAESTAGPASLAVPLTNVPALLNNHNIPGQADDGITIASNGSVSLADIPDAAGAGTPGLVFSLRQNGSSFLPYLTALSNGSFLQDLGSSPDIVSKNRVPVWPVGYAGTGDSILLVTSHVIAVYNSLKGTYAKIFITAAPVAQASAVQAVTLAVTVTAMPLPFLPKF